MSETFAIGEVCILRKCVMRPEHSGREVTVLSGLEPVRLSGRNTFDLAYKLDLLDENGLNFYALPWQLQKKRPPGDERKIGSWDQCPWKPEKVHE